MLSKLRFSFTWSRLETYLDSKSAIPDEEFGFRRGESTFMACEKMLCEIEKTTRRSNHPPYAVFIDYSTVFDTASRTKIVEKLNRVGIGGRPLYLLIAILRKGEVAIEDGSGTLPAFGQTTGVARDDNLSPLLFSVLISDLFVLLLHRRAP